MKAFRNHFRVNDNTSSRLQTYDSGVASVFEVSTADSKDVSINYVGIVKDILKLDYGPLQTLVILLCYKWVHDHDNRGNTNYIRDEAGFLFVNFRPLQEIQWSFCTESVQKLCWYLVLIRNSWFDLDFYRFLLVICWFQWTLGQSLTYKWLGGSFTTVL